MPLNETDTRAQLIEPKLQAAGWIGSQITREHFYRRDHRCTAGRIYLFGDEAREVILALLDKYRIGGVEQLADPRVFRLSPFREMGQVLEVIQRFGGAERLQETVREMQRRIYVA